MSRSRKKIPKGSITVKGCQAGAMKSWKKECSRILRRQSSTDENIPQGNKYKRISGDIWNSPSDGKWYHKDPKALRK